MDVHCGLLVLLESFVGGPEKSTQDSREEKEKVAKLRGDAVPGNRSTGSSGAVFGLGLESTAETPDGSLPESRAEDVRSFTVYHSGKSQFAVLHNSQTNTSQTNLHNDKEGPYSSGPMPANYASKTVQYASHNNRQIIHHPIKAPLQYFED